MNKDRFFLIVRREYLETVAKKSFIVMTLLTPILIVLLGGVPILLEKLNKSDIKTVALIDETERRRSLQLAYNQEHGITPQAIIKARNAIIGIDNEFSQISTESGSNQSRSTREKASYVSYQAEFTPSMGIAADPVVQYMNFDDLTKAIERLRKNMIEAAKNMDFIEAAQLRDELLKLEQRKKALEEI